MCLDFSTQKWKPVLLINLPPATINILAPLSISVSPFFPSFLTLFCSTSSSLFNSVALLLSPSFFSLYILSLISLSPVSCLWPLSCLCISGTRWPNSSLKQRHSIYMQIRRRYVYALLKRCLFQACGAQEVKWEWPCFMHGDTVTGEPKSSTLKVF